MIILALGTNLGSRIHNLYNAISKLSSIVTNITASSIFETKALLPDNAPKSWDINYYNMVISCETKLAPEELLHAIKSIEREMGRAINERWSPRIIDIDILFYHDLCIDSEELSIPHKEVLNRDFVILPLLQIASNLKFPGHNNVYGHTLTQIFNGLQGFQSNFKRAMPFQPKLMGIVNITTDSFSDGGKFIRAEDAINQAVNLHNAGAFYIDFGAQSTNTKSTLLDSDEEFARLNDVLSGFISEVGIDAAKQCISVDSFNPIVLKKLISKYSITMINDQSAGVNKEIVEIAAAIKTKYVLMHSIDLPTSQKYLVSHETPASTQLYNWAKNKIDDLCKAGVDMENIILDPGIGLAKSPLQSIEILQNAKDFKELNCELLIGHSRKYFHTAFTAALPIKRDTETAVEAAMIAPHVDIIRVHNLKKVQKSIVAHDVITRFYPS